MTLSETASYIWHLPAERKGWLVVCFVGSFIAWIAIHATSMKRLVSLMGHHLENRQVATLATREEVIKALRIGQLMSSVSKHVPWECKCLSEALCVKWLLNRYDIPSVFYLGARLDSDDKQGMKAHAWVTVGPRVVIGAAGHKQYQVVATFTTPALH